MALASQQETVLEEFMQNSFGAQKLFVPYKFKLGKSTREPADLAWVDEDFDVLFYMKGTNEELERQITNNLKQAKGFHRFWAMRKSEYQLRGKNRFGDECDVSYQVNKPLIQIMVVSRECGIRLLETISHERPNLVIVLPDAFIHWISSFGGTIVDLLHLAKVFLENFSNINIQPKRAYELLNEITDLYSKLVVKNADPDGEYLKGNREEDYKFILQHLNFMKMPSAFKNAVKDPEGRDLISSLFGDFMYQDFVLLAATAEKVIKMSEPPEFTKWSVAVAKGLHYTFVINSLNFNSTNYMDSLIAATEASKGFPNCVLVQYAKIFEGAEYRVPNLFGINEINKKHATIIIEQLIFITNNFLFKLRTYNQQFYYLEQTHSYL